MTHLAPRTLLDALRSDAARLTAAARGNLDRPVPACPGWDVGDVVRHLGGVYLHKAASVRLGRRAPEVDDGDAPREEDALLAWFGAALDDVLAVVDADPATPAWSWWPPDATVGFWQRRMAQETLVHRVDVEAAAGLEPDVDAALAADGVDEVLTAFLPVWLPLGGAEAGLPAGLAAHVAVRTGGRSWDVRVDGLRAQVAQGSSGTRSEAPAQVAGEPAAVLLWAWGRAGDEDLAVDGDAAQVALLRRALAAATR